MSPEAEEVFECNTCKAETETICYCGNCEKCCKCPAGYAAMTIDEYHAEEDEYGDEDDNDDDEEEDDSDEDDSEAGK